MRTTIELPDELYRAVESRAALDGCAMKDLVRRYVESGLSEDTPTTRRSGRMRSELPVIARGAIGVPVAAVSPEEIRRLDDEEDRAWYDRLIGRLAPAFHWRFQIMPPTEGHARTGTTSARTRLRSAASPRSAFFAT